MGYFPVFILHNNRYDSSPGDEGRKGVEMTGIHTRTLCLAGLVAGFAAIQAGADEEPYFCGTPDAIAEPLAKSEALPRINKVWTGKLKALVIRVGMSDAPYTVDTASIGRTNASINTLYRAMSR